MSSRNLIVALVAIALLGVVGWPLLLYFGPMAIFSFCGSLKGTEAAGLTSAVRAGADSHADLENRRRELRRSVTGWLLLLVTTVGLAIGSGVLGMNGHPPAWAMIVALAWLPLAVGSFVVGVAWGRAVELESCMQRGSEP